MDLLSIDQEQSAAEFASDDEVHSEDEIRTEDGKILQFVSTMQTENCVRRLQKRNQEQSVWGWRGQTIQKVIVNYVDEWTYSFKMYRIPKSMLEAGGYNSVVNVTGYLRQLPSGRTLVIAEGKVAFFMYLIGFVFGALMSAGITAAIVESNPEIAPFIKQYYSIALTVVAIGAGAIFNLLIMFLNQWSISGMKKIIKQELRFRSN